VLLRCANGRTYAADGSLRAATVHLLGDRSGNIPSTFLDYYRTPMMGYDTLRGLWGAGGETMVLTILSQAQLAAPEALGGRNGTVAVFNYRTGEILCAATAPTFDPEFVPDLTNPAYEGVYVNRFTGASYVPGSIFKLVTTAAAIETVPGILNQTFLCEGEMQFGIDKVVCAGVHGEIDLKTALAKSCNCAYAQIALAVGAENLTAYTEKLGLTSSFSVDGITTKAGQIDLTASADVNVAWAGIGQHLDLVNPYGFLRFMGILAGGGAMAEPYFVATAGDYTAAPKQSESILAEETTLFLREFMRNNVETVYGAWQFPDVGVCAKSGTAEAGEGIAPTATFAGFCTDENYPLAFFVAVEQGGSGSETCAPIAGRVLSVCVEEMKKLSKN
jgi:peptidoglycan glycosyltransferase